MSLFASSDRIYIKDSSNTNIIFDTNWKTPAFIQIHESVVSLPERTGAISTTTTDHTIATGLSSDINFRYAMIRKKTNTADSRGTLLIQNTTNWYPVIGSFVLNFLTTSAIDQMRVISFVLSGGSLLLREQYFNQEGVYPAAGYTTIPGIDLRCRVFLGNV